MASIIVTLLESHFFTAAQDSTGYASLSEEGGYAYELQKRQVLGEITTEEESST